MIIITGDYSLFLFLILPIAYSSCSSYLGIHNHVHNILRLFDVFQIFLSPQVKGSIVIINKHGIYELPHELPNDFRLRILQN